VDPVPDLLLLRKSGLPVYFTYVYSVTTQHSILQTLLFIFIYLFIFCDYAYVIGIPAHRLPNETHSFKVNHITDINTELSEQSPSWETNSCSDNQDMFRILYNPFDHYHVHNCLLTVPVLFQTNPVHTLRSH
jgi:hypothetical protein